MSEKDKQEMHNSAIKAIQKAGKEGLSEYEGIEKPGKLRQEGAATKLLRTRRARHQQAGRTWQHLKRQWRWHQGRTAPALS